MPEDLFDSAAKELAGVNPVSTKAPRNLFDDASDELNGVSSKLQIPDPLSVVRKTASNIEAKDPNIQTANSDAKVAQDQNNYGKSKIKDALSMLGIQGSMAVGAPVAAMKSLPWAARIGGTMGLEGTLPYEINHATTNAANKLTGDPQQPRSLTNEALSTILPGVISGMQIRGDKTKAVQALKDTLAKKNASAQELQEGLANYKAASASTGENLTKATNVQQSSLADIKMQIAQQQKVLDTLKPNNGSYPKVKSDLADLVIERTKREQPVAYMQALKQAKAGAETGETHTAADLDKIKSEIVDLEKQVPTPLNKKQLLIKIGIASALLGVGGGYKWAHASHLIP